MRIYFNHWFTTAYYFMQSLKEDGHYIIASNDKDFCLYQHITDEFYVEPVVSSKDYLEWLLNFVKEHKIDVFFAKRSMSDIVHNRSRFEELGVKVVCEENIEMFDILQSKKQTVDFFLKAPPFTNLLIPETHIVNTAEEFAACYSDMKTRYDTLCVKYDRDEGGQSYKKIADRQPKLSRLSENQGLVYSYDYLYQCLNSVDSFKDLIVMPYLVGEEISIDCLGLGDNLIAIPRRKVGNRIVRLEMDENLIKIAKEIYNLTKLKEPFNIQVRKDEYGNLYLLEINTRLSGGSWKDRYIGCDFAKLATQKAIGQLTELPAIEKQIVEIGNLESCIEVL